MSDNSYKQTLTWKSPLNIWTWGYHWVWTHPSSWWDCIKQFFRNFRFAWQRTVRGYCDKDVWDLDEYYSNLFFSSLNNLAEVTHSYPGRGQFSTPEAWEKYLKEMANHFKYCAAAHEAECYPCDKLFKKYLEDYTDENAQAWRDSEKQKDAESIYHERVGLNMMQEVYFDLWD